MKNVDSSASTHPSARKADYGLLLALALSLLAALPLLIGPGIVNTRAGGDSPFLLIRVHQLTENIQQGIWPARWMPDAAYGLGYPFFSYYASLPYYVAALLSQTGLGILWGIKLSQTLGFLLAGGMSYLLARKLGMNRAAALLVTAVYTYAPFHMINVYVRGDSLSEFYAMGLYPLVGWALIRLEEQPTPQRAAILAASYALLMLSHNISVMLFSPLLALWLFALSWKHGQRRRMLLYGGGAIAVGFMLSAWFWAPALREQSLVQLGDQTTGYFHYSGHFLDQDLVQMRVLHDYGITNDQAPFAMGLVQACMAIGGLLVLVARLVRRKTITATWCVMSIGLLFYTWLMTSSSHIIWEHIPLLPYTQFPWRLLSVQSLAVSLLAGLLANKGANEWNRVIAALLILLGTIAGLGGTLDLERLPVQENEINAEHVMAYETYSLNIGTTIRHEYLPQEMVPRPYVSGVQLNAGQKPAPLALEGALESADLVHQGAEREEWQISVSEKALVAFHTTWFPGWEASVDGTEQDVEPLRGLGLIGLRLAPGTHQVTLHFESTPVRRYSGWLSIVGLVVLVLAMLEPTLRPTEMSTGGRTIQWRRAVISILCAGTVFLWITLAPILTPRQPQSKATAAMSGPLVMDHTRSPWLHHESQGLQFGTTWLDDYSLSGNELTPGESLDVTFYWREVNPDYEARIRLFGASSHLMEPYPVWGDIRSMITTREQTLSMPIPKNLAPGLYVIRIEVREDGERVPIHDIQGQRMKRLASEPLPLTAMRTEPTDTETKPLGQFGPETKAAIISLLDVVVTNTDEDWIEVGLTWRSEKQAPLNYMLSARIQDADGQKIGSRDVQPLLGGYPTSLWRPGELIYDKVRIIVPEAIWDEIPDEGLQAEVEIVLYDRLTLLEAGSTIVKIGPVPHP